MNNDASSALYYVGPEAESRARPLSDEEARVLDHINQKIAAEPSLRDLMKFLFDQIQPLVPCERIGVSFLEEDDSRMVLKIVISSYEPLYLAEGYSADLEGSSLEKIFSSDAPRVISDLSAYAADHPESESTRLIRKEGIQSSMTCPLLVDGRPVGLLFLSSARANAYSERELRLHHAIAERLSQAVEKAYMIEKLTESLNSYLDMLSFVTHELKSPLDSIVTMGNTMIAGYLGKLDGQTAGYLERMMRKARYLSDLISQYLNLSRFESGRISFYPARFDFAADVLRESLDIIGPQVSESGAVLTVEAPPSLEAEGDPSLLKIVVNNLLSNAVKYGVPDGEIRVSLKSAGDRLFLSVWNRGPGFPESEKPRLFRKFSRVQTPELLSRKGTGVGLYTSWRIVRLHGGKMDARSSEGQWAEFFFTMPLAQTGRTQGAIEDSPE